MPKEMPAALAEPAVANVAPVSASADLDLGVPGWKYDVSFEAQKVPLAPLVNTFQPERKGQVGGTTTVQGHISGAGITGALARSLDYQIEDDLHEADALLERDQRHWRNGEEG